MTPAQGALGGLVLVGGVGIAALATEGFGLLTAKYSDFIDYAKKALNRQLIGDTTFDENKIKEYLKSSQNDNKEYKNALKTNWTKVKGEGEDNDLKGKIEKLPEPITDETKAAQAANKVKTWCEATKDKKPTSDNNNKKDFTKSEITQHADWAAFEAVCLEEVKAKGK